MTLFILSWFLSGLVSFLLFMAIVVEKITVLDLVAAVFMGSLGGYMTTVVALLGLFFHYDEKNEFRKRWDVTLWRRK